MASPTSCPKCDHDQFVRAGVVQERQRWRCKRCGYHFTVNKLGKRVDPYYVVKALQLHLEGISLREIERILGVSHTAVAGWIKQYHIQVPEQRDYRPTYKVLDHLELQAYVADRSHVTGAGMMITELGDKFMVIRWERFRQDR
jgi:transposase-like protein